MNSSPIWHPLLQKRFKQTLMKVVSAKGAYLYLEEGRKLLDLTCSWWVNLHGHAHPAIAKAIYDQALSIEQVLFSNFTHEPALQLSTDLLSLLPDHFAKVFFSDNGSTAVEVALKIAYQYWINKGEKRRKRFLAFEEGYHGDTLGAMSVSAPSIFTNLFSPLLFEVARIPFPATFDGDPDVEEKEQKALQAAKKLLENGGEEYAAVILEPLVQGAEGMRICRIEFLQKLEKLFRQYDILTIYDEVFVGFGRTGDWFACTKAKTRPDIICLSKGITGGFLPLSVTITTEKIFEAFYQDDPLKTFFHAHSYTANPLGCAAAIASLKLLKENPERFQRMEKWHRKHSSLLQDHPKIKNLRFCGTIAAFDLLPEEQGGYLDPVGIAIQEKCLREGIYIRPLGNTIYFVPPYCIEEEELAGAYKVLVGSVQNLIETNLST